MAASGGQLGRRRELRMETARRRNYALTAGSPHEATGQKSVPERSRAFAPGLDLREWHLPWAGFSMITVRRIGKSLHRAARGSACSRGASGGFPRLTPWPVIAARDVGRRPGVGRTGRRRGATGPASRANSAVGNKPAVTVSECGSGKQNLPLNRRRARAIRRQRTGKKFPAAVPGVTCSLRLSLARP